MNDRTNDAPAGALLRLKAGASASAKRELINLVNTTFLTNDYLWVNPATGEMLSLPRIPPVSVGFIEFADGGGEIFATRRVNKKADFSEDMLPAPLAPTSDDLLLKAQRSSEVACRRAQTRIRRICRFYNLHVMVTLTFPGEGIHDFDEAQKCVQRFINYSGDYLHLMGAYVAVPELHPNGHGWHWHVLIKRRLKKTELQKLREKWTLFLWRKGLKPSGGANFVRVNVKDFGSSQASASYACKYVGKAFGDDEKEKHRKRYLYSQKNHVPIQRGHAWHLDQIKKILDLADDAYSFDSREDDKWQGPDMVWASW